MAAAHGKVLGPPTGADVVQSRLLPDAPPGFSSLLGGTVSTGRALAGWSTLVPAVSS